MAEQNNDSTNVAKSSQEDKSINDLLKEYAHDVKDKDIDDFLKGSDDDAFERESGDDDADEDEKPVVVEKPRRSGGLLTGLMMLVAFGAAGAGTYLYLNRDEGMTSIMGGFSGGSPSEAVADSPPAPQDQPILPAPAQPQAAQGGMNMQPQAAQGGMNMQPQAAQGGMNMQPQAAQGGTDMPPQAALPAQPSPILNAPEAATGDSTAVAATGAAVHPGYSTMEDAGTLVTHDNPAPATGTNPSSDVSSAVDAWAAGSAGLTAQGDAALPERSVDEIKARPPVTAKKEKPVKAAAAVDNAVDNKDDRAGDEPVAKDDVKKAKEEAPAPRKAASRAASPYDEALPPPFMSKSGAKVAAAAPAGKMAPVVEGGARAEVNGNLADVSAATGDIATLVRAGGGSIETTREYPATFASPARAVQTPLTAPLAAPVAARAAQRPVGPSEAAVDSGVVPADVSTLQGDRPADMPALAIGGGRSLPPSDGVDMPAPDTAQAVSKRNPDTAQAVSKRNPDTASAPVVTPVPAAPAVRTGTQLRPAQPVSTPASMPAPAQASGTDARAAVAQAMALEKAGKTEEALALYQRALELDAVYADGKSIDRGMVYDRIGAIRAGK